MFLERLVLDRAVKSHDLREDHIVAERSDDLGQVAPDERVGDRRMGTFGGVQPAILLDQLALPVAGVAHEEPSGGGGRRRHEGPVAIRYSLERAGPGSG